MTKTQRKILNAISDWKSEHGIRIATGMNAQGKAGSMAMSLIALDKRGWIEWRFKDTAYRITDKGREALSQS